MMKLRLIKNPITLKRMSRFREMKRAHFSLWMLLALYGISLFSEFICNDIPIYVRYHDTSYFPIFRFYSEDEFTGNGKMTRADYKAVYHSPAFRSNSKNVMIFPPIPYGPYESIDPESIALSETVDLSLEPMPMIGAVNIARDHTIVRSLAFGPLVDIPDQKVRGRALNRFFLIPDDLKAALESRFENRKSPPVHFQVQRLVGGTFSVSLSTFLPHQIPPKTVRLTFRESFSGDSVINRQVRRYEFDRTLQLVRSSISMDGEDIWHLLSAQQLEMIQTMVSLRFSGPVDRAVLTINNRRYRVIVEKEDVRFPFHPTRGHILGIDGAGRDVLARILYGLRTSLTFGFLLVLCTMFLGILAGSVQGYFGGLPDIAGQRLIEIWSALPFLYIMILMGSVYGRSFSLLLLCYGIFNWIGISYYIRAEFLRLRKLPFVETAKCMGISSINIIWKHILPNAMVPVITFFPFSLVGAIGALAALDYLGFGLPPPTPSWGELLFQAQQYRWAWWLILYPSLALFAVMLLGVFVGEGVRNAYDPKRFTKLA